MPGSKREEFAMAARKHGRKKDEDKLESPEANAAAAESREVEATVTRPPDRVASVSYRQDGTPDQSDGFEVID